MASAVVATKSVLLFMLLLLLRSEASLSAAAGSTDCGDGAGSCLSSKTTWTEYSRKLLTDMLIMRDHTEELLVPSTTMRGRSEAVVNQLRKVPAGPDPMHHNGGSPKKPIIIP